MRTRIRFMVVSFMLVLDPLVDVFGFHAVAPAMGKTNSRVRTWNTARQLAPQQLGSFEELDTHSERVVSLYDWSDIDPIPFTEMWDFQKELVQRHLDKLSVKDDTEMQQQHVGLDSVIMLQHEPVYTLGTASDPNFIIQQERVDVVRMDRGGEVTYHGPGQLVVYPILDLRGYRQDIHWYMRALEEAVLLALDYAGVEGATREDDVTGVWVENEKVAAIGIKARRWVTMHGLAVNVEQSSLSNFDGIVPCGLEGRAVSCVNQHLDEPLTVKEFAVHMKAALERVFRVRLVAATDSSTRFVQNVLVGIAKDAPLN